MTELRRFLVTAPDDLRLDLWAATSMMTNWLEGRDAGPGRQTWHVMSSGPSSGFLSAAESIGVTVEEIHGTGNSESYELLVGRPGTGWQATCWENRNSRRTVNGASRTWPRPGEPACGLAAPCPDAECSREPGHPGRHMASSGGGFGYAVGVAWPGTHAPVVADLGGAR